LDAHEANDRASATVFVVDDHEMVAEMLTRALGGETDLVMVGVASTVHDAVVGIAESCPDLVVIDYQLADGTGVTATREIKAHCPEVEVIMLTGHADGATLAEALEAGCSGFVTKDALYEDLVHTIHQVLLGVVTVPPSMLGELAASIRPRPVELGDDLTVREREVLAMLARGLSTEQMVDELMLSIHTVRNHIRNVLTKLQARSRLEAVAVAIRLGVIAPIRPT
jgi:DNA-binding NarL/FixJ family response regulator